MRNNFSRSPSSSHLSTQTTHEQEKEKGEARRVIGKVEAKEGSCAEDVVLWLSFVVTAGVLVVAGTRQRRRQG